MIKHFSKSSGTLLWECPQCKDTVTYKPSDFSLYYERDLLMQEDRTRPAMRVECPHCDSTTFFFVSKEEDLDYEDNLVINAIFESKGLHKPHKREKDKQAGHAKIRIE